MEKLYSKFLDSSGICTDTRKISDNCLFVCIQGENFNGNTFASKALEAGAGHIIVDDPTYFVDGGSMTLVEDSVVFLQQLATHHRRQFSIPVIGITGSNGKTSTKELIHAVLAKKYTVLATIGNLNNHLGVPFTLLRMNSSHEIAIIEMGANKLKDIEELSAIAEPTHGIITNIGKAHLEGFGGFEGVLITKTELYAAIEQVNGTIFYNHDDPILCNALPKNTSTFSYGSSNAEITGELTGLTPFVQMRWSHGAYTSEVLETHMIGKYNFHNFLAAAAFGIFFEVDTAAISEAIVEYEPTNNRSQVKKTERNTLILDCYNANPTSMRSALESFGLIEHSNKLAILGDMKELGDVTDLEHKIILEQAESLGITAITVGESFGKHSSSAVKAHFATTDDLLSYLASNSVSNQLILLKGSRSIGLEKAEALL